MGESAKRLAIRNASLPAGRRCSEIATVSGISDGTSASGQTLDILGVGSRGTNGHDPMIGAAECRERAAECRQMAEGEQSSRVQSILIDMARTWERLAIEAEQSTPRTSPKQVLRPTFVPRGPSRAK